MKFSKKNRPYTTSKTRKNKGPFAKSKSINKDIIKYMLQMLITVKLYHWNTLSYSVHKATDDLYGDLNTLIDQFVEVLLGKHNNMNEKRKNEMLNIKTLSLDNYKDNGKFKTAVESYKKYLIGLNKHFKQSENSDLFNIRDEILAALNKISYLLTLK
jgi:DNA-binding ferritin-like protein|tara:strand:- start:30 stop:500 length:471 start_codon:yes stop_codon:yes gene_type:complete